MAKERKRRELRTLDVPLTLEELATYSDELARKIGEIHQAEALKADMAREFKGRIDELELRVANLAKYVRSKAEPRQVDCEWSLDLKRATATLMRLDSGEIVESRTLSAGELAEARQVGFPAIVRDPVTAEADEVLG
jgi:hypothetical protein